LVTFRRRRVSDGDSGSAKKTRKKKGFRKRRQITAKHGGRVKGPRETCREKTGLEWQRKKGGPRERNIKGSHVKRRRYANSGLHTPDSQANNST